VRGAGIFGCYVLAARTVAALAGNAEVETRFLVAIFGRAGWDGSEISGMALEASRIYRASEIGGAIFVAGAVDPPFERSPVRYRELKEAVGSPI